MTACGADDDSDMLSRQPNPALGEIRVLVQPTMVTSYTTTAALPAVALKAGKMHERSKKAGVHSVGYASTSLRSTAPEFNRLGPVSVRAPPLTVNIADCGPPIFAFLFRYRPLGAPIRNQLYLCRMLILSQPYFRPRASRPLRLPLPLPLHLLLRVFHLPTSRSRVKAEQTTPTKTKRFVVFEYVSSLPSEADVC
jgi:hypothetical protein